jgi:hypothetical protein
MIRNDSGIVNIDDHKNPILHKPVPMKHCDWNFIQNWMLFSVHIQEVQRVHMDEDPPMDEVSSNEVYEEAETGGDTLGFPFSLSLSQTSSRN